MNSVRIKKSGRRNQDNSEDIVERIARRLLGRYLGVSAMYFSRPVGPLAREAEEADKAVREAGEENKVDAAAPAKINEAKWKAIQSFLLSYVLNSGEKARKIFSAGVF